MFDVMVVVSRKINGATKLKMQFTWIIWIAAAIFNPYIEECSRI